MSKESSEIIQHDPAINVEAVAPFVLPKAKIAKRISGGSLAPGVVGTIEWKTAWKSGHDPLFNDIEEYTLVDIATPSQLAPVLEVHINGHRFPTATNEPGSPPQVPLKAGWQGQTIRKGDRVAFVVKNKGGFQGGEGILWLAEGPGLPRPEPIVNVQGERDERQDQLGGSTSIDLTLTYSQAVMVLQLLRGYAVPSMPDRTGLMTVVERAVASAKVRLADQPKPKRKFTS